MSVQPDPRIVLQPPTLADIAREAGTSPSTASRALSGRGYVSDSVRDRLLEVADRLGYVPNASARTLKQRTSRVVGVVVSDLGNQFYSAWLDTTMTYSSALFTGKARDLASAQIEKYAALARELDLRPEHHVLEIGCGWGGFAEYAGVRMAISELPHWGESLVQIGLPKPGDGTRVASLTIPAGIPII